MIISRKGMLILQKGMIILYKGMIISKKGMLIVTQITGNTTCETSIYINANDNILI